MAKREANTTFGFDMLKDVSLDKNFLLKEVQLKK